MKVLDLFSGIGGFSLGLERAGMETVAFCEIDKACQQVLKKHRPQIPIFEDIKKLKGKQLKELGQIDLICGGFPCQDISVAGKQRGINASRSGLWKEFHRIIKEVHPKYVVIENVANLRSQGLARIIKDLWTIGYDCEWHIISARSVGACHLRERIWVIAYPNGSDLREQQQRITSRRLQDRVQDERQAELRNNGQARDDCFTNTDNFRFWRPFATEKEKQKWWSKATACFRAVFDKIRETKPTVCRDNDGLSRGLDKDRRERIKQLGNAVVPQIPQIIGESIIAFERKQCTK